LDVYKTDKFFVGFKLNVLTYTKEYGNSTAETHLGVLQLSKLYMNGETTDIITKLLKWKICFLYKWCKMAANCKQLPSYCTHSATMPLSKPLPTTTTGHYTICCKKSQSCAPEDGQKLPETC